MNPGDKVRVTKSIPSHYEKEGIFEKWVQSSHFSEQYCLVSFSSSNSKLSDYKMTIAPWDLEVVEPESHTCDNKVIRGQRFRQEHTCTLPAAHKNDHYCGVCRYSWPNDTIEVIEDSAVPIGQVYIVDKSYKRTNNEGS